MSDVLVKGELSDEVARYYLDYDPEMKGKKLAELIEVAYIAHDLLTTFLRAYHSERYFKQRSLEESTYEDFSALF